MKREGRYWSNFGKERFCRGSKPGHFAPTDSFRPLPGALRREVCDVCWIKLVKPKE